MARRWHRGRGATSPAQGPAKGRPYLVTGSTSGAGGANGASQASETVFARSAISTFGTGVALGGEDAAGLPAELQPRGGTPLLSTPLLCTLGPSSSPEGLRPSSSSSLAMQKSRAQLPARSKGLSPRDTSVPEHPIPVAPALLRGAPAGGGASGCRRGQGCEQRTEGTRRDLGDTSGPRGHVLCHPWRLAGRQHHVLRASPADRGALGFRGHREHQHHPGQEGWKRGISEQSALLWWRKFLPGDVLEGRGSAPTLAPSLPGAPLAPRGPWGPGGPWTPRSPGKPLSPCRRGRKGAEHISGALGGQNPSRG